jgi:hypothetical protein
MNRRLPHFLDLGLALLVVFLLPRVAGSFASTPGKRFPTFVDITKQAGLNIRITLGDEVTEYLIEVKSLGVCFFDYDNDGFQDIFFVNGSSRQMESAGRPPHDYLFHNNGDGSFTEVTAKARLGDSGWHTGCSVGDYDNDGDMDLFVTNYGPNRLYRNNADGTFADVTAAAGVAGPTWNPPKWSMGAGFGDVDNDGDLDLYVPNFVKFDYDILPPPNPSSPCKMKGVPIACAPDMYEAQQDLFYRNNGDGTFSDISQTAGIIRERPGKGFGVVFSDFDIDGDQDMYVICDAGQNFYYVNDGKGSFSDFSMPSGTGVDGFGNSQGSMGVWVGDVNHDGLQDLVIGNFIQQIKTLYINQGGNLFLDQTAEWGIGDLAFNYSTWGIGLLDFNNDGWLDLWVTNGHTMEQLEKYYPDDTFAEPDYVLRNEEGKRFVDVSEVAGIRKMPNKVGRGAAFADMDNDGDTDALVTNKNDSPTLWRNDGGNARNWITIRTEGVKSNRSGFGARVVAKTTEMQQTFEVRSSQSFLSSNDPRVFVGLGDAEVADIEIRWPSGQVDRTERVAKNRFYLALEGHALRVDPQVKVREKTQQAGR